MTGNQINNWDIERQEFLDLLSSVKREGIHELIVYLEEETDFYIAPSSTKFHDACDGGLLHHSLKVYHNLVRLNDVFNGVYTRESLIVIGLLHDLCKVNFYKKKTRQVKTDDVWAPAEFIDIDDQLPLGHGEKSVILLQRYIPLNMVEIMAIRWHMMAYDDLHCTYAGNKAITNASSKFPIIVLTHIADLSASFLELRENEVE